MEEKKINLYFVSDIKGPKARDGAYGYILEYETGKGPATLTKIGCLRQETENEAVVNVLLEALSRLKNYCRIGIYTESDYLAGVLKNNWLQQWENNGWKSKKGEQIKYEQKWREIKYLLGVHRFEVYLKEHHEYREWLVREVEKKHKEEWEHV